MAIRKGHEFAAMPPFGKLQMGVLLGHGSGSSLKISPPGAVCLAK